MKTVRATLFIIVACAATLAPPDGFAQSERNKKDEPVAPETGRAGKSPMPAGKYEFSDKEMGLVRPRPEAYDAALAEMCRLYARSDARTLALR